jgi:type II secretory pathway component PulF
MPRYYYRARDTFGRAHEGIEVAASEDEVLRALSQMKLTPVDRAARRNGNGVAGTAGASPRLRPRRPRRPSGAMFRRPSSRARRCSRASSPR